MKTLNTFIFIVAGTFCFSQLQPFTNTDFGRFEPKFLHQGYLIGNNYTESGEFNGIHKLNLSNGETTQFSFGESGSFHMPTTDTRNSHLDNIYVSSYPGSGFRKMSLSENYVYDYLTVDAFSIFGTVFKDRIYFNFYLNATYYYDLLTEELVLLSDHPISGILFHNMLTIDNNMFAIRNLSIEEGQQGSRLLKFDSSYEVVDYIENTLNSEGEGDYISNLFAFSPNGRLTVNGREIFIAQMHSGIDRLLSVDPDNFQSTNFISGSVPFNLIDYIIVPDGVIFKIDGNYYKTDGVSSLEQIDYLDQIGVLVNFRSSSPYNLFNGTSSGSSEMQGNSFLQTENVTYFNARSNDQVEHLYKMTSMNSTPELIYSAVHEGFTFEMLRHATDWNGNLLFVVQDNDSTTADKIYIYTGTELILNPDLNDFSGKTLDEQPAITGLFTYGDLLLVNTQEGVYSIEYDEVMSTSEEIVNSSRLKFYPNPTKEFIYFSEKLKELKIYNLSGKLIKTQNNADKKLSVSELPNGTYIISGIDELGKKLNSKFIKN